MIMWLNSDRAIPRSFSMMEGFGVHTFRLVNEQGVSRFVKFHWKPVLGIHSLVWDEAQKLAGKDPDFLRRDLWNAIEAGNFPEFELGLQVIEEGEEGQFPFDILDPTKIWPEELVPVRRVGRLVLDRNPENFFAETEQIAFHLGNLVPGIDVSDDPLLQGRLFSYLDTQLIRLGGPNFAQLPINQPLAAVTHNQRDGYHQHRVDRGRVSYSPNSLAEGAPRQDEAGFVSYPKQVAGSKVRERSESFNDHFSQATLFWNSMSVPEKDHIVRALRFELGKCTTMHIRERMVDILTNVDVILAAQVAQGIGVAQPSVADPEAARRAALERLREGWERFGSTATPGEPRLSVEQSPALSQLNTISGNIKGRRVAILAAEGVNATPVTQLRDALLEAGADSEIVSLRLGEVRAASGPALEATATVLTMASVMYDGVFVAGGRLSADLLCDSGDAVHWVREAYKHCKPIGAVAEGAELIAAALGELSGDGDAGVVIARDNRAMTSGRRQFIEALGRHRFFLRPQDSIPA